MRTLEWPSQEAVMLVSFQLAGVGLAVGFQTSTPISEMRSRTKRGVQLWERPIQAALPAALAPPASLRNLRRETFLRMTEVLVVTCSVFDCCSDIVFRDCRPRENFAIPLPDGFGMPSVGGGLCRVK